jgi:antitoxin (DNA-binding transcriptional repressor) of toxin-antitoxin stability system
MPQAIPVSSQTDYNEVLSVVDNGEEVVLTKDGIGRYAVVPIGDWNYTKSMLRFLTDMRAVDDEMQAGGATYTEAELLSSLGITV